MITRLEGGSQSNILETDDYLSWLSQNLRAQKLLLISSGYFKRSGTIDKILSNVHSGEYKTFCNVTPNPTVKNLEAIKSNLVDWQPDLIIAIGGGSVMDTAKIVARWLKVPQVTEVLDLMNVHMDSQGSSVCPLLGISTTSGTGAEVTPFATLWDDEQQKKHSLVTAPASTVLLDPSLTVSLNEDNTLFPALDALSHAMESVWNKNHNFLSDLYAGKSIELICQFLPVALKEPENLDARRALQRAAILSGLSIAKTKTALAHAMSYPLTLKYNIPHGLACSVTLLPILNLYGAALLRISGDVKKSVEQLLKSLCLPHRLAQYVEPDQLISECETNLDPKRAGNFFPAIQPDTVKQLLVLAVESNVKGTTIC